MEAHPRIGQSARLANRGLQRAMGEQPVVALILVPTPLGNLRDVTLRALDVLRSCDLLVAEDTRVARRLLSALQLPSKPLRSYREQNAAEVTTELLARARTECVALVTDAGMPAISDPGQALVAAAREAGVEVEVLPGASAFVCAAVLSGFELNGFSFEGFPPRAQGRRERAFRSAHASGHVTVWYEAPGRIFATLETLARIAPAGRVFLVRELTKFHEQQVLGTPAEVLAALAQPVRGEITLVLAPATKTPAVAAPPEAGVDGEIDRMLAAGASVATVARELARLGFGSRAELYGNVLARKRDRHEP